MTSVACRYLLTRPCASTEPSRFCSEQTRYAAWIHSTRFFIHVALSYR